MATLPMELLEVVRNFLNRTWEDPEGDIKLLGSIERGMRYLNEVAGAELDYTAEDKPRELLFYYCMYDQAHALYEFEINYQPALLALQIRQEVKAYAEEHSDPDPDI